jgi:hypothetical protein
VSGRCVTKIALSGLLVGLASAICATGSPAPPGRGVTVDARQQAVSQVLTDIARQSGVAVVAEARADAPLVSIQAVDVTVEEALDRVAAAMGSRRVRVGGVNVLERPFESLPAEQQGWPSALVRDGGEAIVELLRSLSEDQREALGGGELLPWKRLSPEQRASMIRVTRMERFAQIGSEDWAQLFPEADEVGVGMVFDPYVRVVGSASRTERHYLCATVTVPRYQVVTASERGYLEPRY